MDYDTQNPQTGPSGSVTGTYGNVLEKREYDYGNGASGPLIRRTVYTYLAFTNSSYKTLNMMDRVSSVTVYDGAGNMKSKALYSYDGGTLQASGVTTQHLSLPSGTLRGNQTSVQRWLNTTGTYLTTSTKYYDTGMPYQVTDPKGNLATFSYSPTYTGAYVTQTTMPPTGSVQHIISGTYDFNTGLLTSFTDQNSQTSTYSYDFWGRITSASFPDGGQSTFTYTDLPLASSVERQQKITSSLSTDYFVYFDGLARAKQTKLNSDPQGAVYVDTTYDTNGRKSTVSNPYRSAGGASYGVTSYAYDALSRVTRTTQPDGSTIQTAYCGNSTLVTEEASHWRRSITDGLGRLTEVDEPNSTTATVNSNGCPGTGEPVWVTTYSYDPLDDLVGVVQGGSRNRTFVYDSLKRLTSSTNPEAGTVAYTYDSNSNVATKTDARGITTNYSPAASPIDALNRVTSVTYSDATPTVTYSYDQSACLGQPACFNIGRRTGMTDAGGTAYMSFDKMGRQLAEQRTTNGVIKTASYGYDLAGDITTLTYPSGRTITYSYDSAARPVSAIDLGNSISYAINAAYAPQGALAQIQNGSNLVTTSVYNNRLQPCWIYATTGTALPTSAACTGAAATGNILDLKYNFNLGAGDNGNVMGITNNRDTSRTQSFSYDQLNRIVTGQTSATTGSNCWGETFAYDQWANLLSIGAATGYTGCNQENLSVGATTNNRISATGVTYDLSGNMLSDGALTYAWNAESQIKTAAGVNYTYDGDGNRVQKSNGKIYWYGAGSEILDESDLSGNFTSEYVFFGGKRIARRDVASGTVYFYAEDMLGSSRTIVQAGQTTPCYDADFYPYGGERVITNTCPQGYKFQGKERDTETGNDDFGARYYSSRFGRWLSADWSAVPAPVPYANLTNPQTLNLYAMVADNPETFADLDGHAGQVLSPPPSEVGANSCMNQNQTGCNEDTTKRDTSPAQSQKPPTTTSRSAVVSVGWTVIALNVTTTTTYNEDGSIASTQTTYTQMVFDAFPWNGQGSLLSATQSTTSNANGTQIDPKVATSMIGAAAVIRAQSIASQPAYGAATGLAFGNDMQAHPWRWLGNSAGFMLPGLLQGKVLLEGALTGVEALNEALHLRREMHKSDDSQQ